MKILHNEKKIAQIADDVAIKEFKGTGGLSGGTIYEEFASQVAQEYADYLFENN